MQKRNVVMLCVMSSESGRDTDQTREVRQSMDLVYGVTLVVTSKHLSTWPSTWTPTSTSHQSTWRRETIWCASWASPRPMAIITRHLAMRATTWPSRLRTTTTSCPTLADAAAAVMSISSNSGHPHIRTTTKFTVCTEWIKRTKFVLSVYTVRKLNVVRSALHRPNAGEINYWQSDVTH